MPYSDWAAAIVRGPSRCESSNRRGWFYLDFVRVVQLVRLSCRARDDLAIEIVMLRHEVALPHGASTCQAVWVGQASSHEITVPAQPPGRLDEEPSETGPR